MRSTRLLAKTTDSHPKVRAALRFRAYKLCAGARPAGAPVPEPPDDYDELPWRDPLPRLAEGLENVLRLKLNGRKVDVRTPHPALLAASSIGWLFSEWRPDATVGRT